MQSPDTEKMKMMRESIEKEERCRQIWAPRWGWIMAEIRKNKEMVHEYRKHIPKTNRKVILGPHLGQDDSLPKPPQMSAAGVPRKRYSVTTNGDYGRLSWFPLEDGGPAYLRIPTELPDTGN